MNLKSLVTRRTRTWWLVVGAIVTALLVPAVAYGVPGSGSFVSNSSAGGESLTYLYNIIAKICVGILIVVEGVLFYAIFKFRRQSDDEDPEPVHGNLRLEVGWTLAALVIQIFIGWKSVEIMYDVEQEPKRNAELVVEAVANQWDWKFRYPQQEFRGEKIGGFKSDHLVVPAYTRVELDVTSEDVLHSIFIPKLGVKIDAVPGRFNYWWFSAKGPTPAEVNGGPRPPRAKSAPYVTTDWTLPETLKPGLDPNGYYTTDGTDRVDFLGRRETKSGWEAIASPESSPFDKYRAKEYAGMCTELCGKGHWNMYFRTVAMSTSSFFQWLEDRKGGNEGPVNGAVAYSNNCAQCHGADGQGAGSQYPPLVGSKWTIQSGSDKEINEKDHIGVVLQGSQHPSLQGPTTVKGKTYDSMQMQMVGLNNNLTNKEVAAIVNHERTSWGNSGGKVTPEDVAKVRDELGLDPVKTTGKGEVEVAKLEKEGEELYQACAGCHGADGKGPKDVPNLAGNPAVIAGSARSLVKTAVNRIDTDEWPGAHTPVARDMTDREIAALLTYVRRNWVDDDKKEKPKAIQPKDVSDILDDIGRY